MQALVGHVVRSNSPPYVLDFERGGDLVPLALPEGLDHVLLQVHQQEPVHLGTELLLATLLATVD